MLATFKYVGSLITRIIVMWQAVSINGFRPFWYLVGIALLGVFGFLIRGLLSGGEAGSSVSRVASASSRVKTKVKIKTISFDKTNFPSKKK